MMLSGLPTRWGPSSHPAACSSLLRIGAPKHAARPLASVPRTAPREGWVREGLWVQAGGVGVVPEWLCSWERCQGSLAPMMGTWSDLQGPSGAWAAQ